MWPVWSMPDRADLDFTETINKRMRVPSRLKVADDSSSRYPKRASSEDFPSTFQMYVPDRLLPAGSFGSGSEWMRCIVHVASLFVCLCVCWLGH